jgi:hypothetical protein
MDALTRSLSRGWLALVLLCCLLGSAPACADTLTVAEAYVDLHTGPGRGYPATQVLERGDRVELLGQRTDWLLLRAERGPEGWAHRSDLPGTLAAAGATEAVRKRGLADYVARDYELGLSIGGLERDPVWGLRGAWHAHRRLAVELRFDQVAGTYSNTSLYGVDLLIKFMPEERLVPHLSLGLGRVEDAPRKTLLDGADADGDTVGIGVGLSYYLNRRALLRADLRHQWVDVRGHETDLQSATVGLGFFF